MASSEIPSAKLTTPDDVVRLIAPGSTLMVGGFGLVGAPLTVLAAINRAGYLTQLTVISNNLGEPGRGLGRLLLDGQITKAIGSFFTSNPDVVQWHAAGKLQVELMPQGTMAECIRAGGAGIGGFFTRTGVGTELARDREERIINGHTYLFYRGLRADVALIRAHVADELGNLTYLKTGRNFNPEMATAADLVIAEVDDIVAAGQLHPEAIVTPHLFVDRLIRSQETP